MTVSLAPRATAHRTADELRALAESGNAELGSLTGHEASPAEVVRWVAENFSTDAVAVACSMADAALPHLVAARLPGVDVLFLDTGYHFAETRHTRDEVQRALDVRVVDPHNRRRKLCLATQEGVDFVARLHDGMQRAQDRLIEPLAPADRAKFLELLLELINANNDFGRTVLRSARQGGSATPAKAKTTSQPEGD